MKFESLHPQFDFDRWSRAGGWLQRLDPRAKTLAMLAVLAAISLALPREYVATARLYAAGSLLWLITVVTSRLPVWPLYRRALLVLPFTLVFAVVSWLSGDPQRAVAISAKALLSAQFAVLLAASTPMENLLAGMERCHAPRLVLTITLLIYRYLFLIASQARRMRMAAEARGSQRRFAVAAGTLAVLFARSQERATGLHRAMLARGFQGSFPPLAPLSLSLADGVFIALALPAAVGLHWVGRL